MSTPGNYDYFAAPPAATPPDTPPPAPPVAPPPGPAWSGYAPHEQVALLTARSQSMQNMRPRRLGFLARLEIGLNLARTCWRVLASEPVLAVVPVVMLVVGGALLLGYATAFGGVDTLLAGGKLEVAVRTFPLAVLLNVLGVIAQAVIVDGATNRMQLGRTSLTASWAKALGHLPDLCGFALVLTVERTITGMLRGRRGGDLIANLFDRAWDFATFLSVPVILYENAGGLASVKRSAQLVRQRWAAQLAAGGAIHLAILIIGLPVMILVGLLGFAVTPVLGIALVLLVLLVVVVISAALSGILSAAMYRYAVTGEISIGFSETDMWRVFDRVR
jgi:hypothetical protein